MSDSQALLLYARVWRSTDYFATYSDTVITEGYKYQRSLFRYNGIAYISSSEHLFSLQDDGTFSTVWTFPTNGQIQAGCVTPLGVAVCVRLGSVIKSEDFVNWNTVGAYPAGSYPVMCTIGETIVIVNQVGTFLSGDYGATWTKVSEWTDSPAPLRLVRTYYGRLVAWVSVAGTNLKIYTSDNNGLSWTLRYSSAGGFSVAANESYDINEYLPGAMYIIGGLSSTDNRDVIVLVSSNNGTEWTELAVRVRDTVDLTEQVAPFHPIYSNLGTWAFAVRYVAPRTDRVWVSTDYGASWANTVQGPRNTFASGGPIINFGAYSPFPGSTDGWCYSRRRRRVK